MKREIFVVLALTAGVACGAPGLASAADKDMKSDKSGTYKPDNTKANKEMRSNQEMTAEQQKENPSDRKISQHIRRNVVKDKSLSTYGHNVKIITKDGNVTLKGLVRDEAEKSRIEKIATGVLAGSGKVTDELTVAPKETKEKKHKKSKDTENKSE